MVQRDIDTNSSLDKNMMQVGRVQISVCFRPDGYKVSKIEFPPVYYLSKFLGLHQMERWQQQVYFLKLKEAMRDSSHTIKEAHPKLYPVFVHRSHRISQMDMWIHDLSASECTYLVANVLAENEGHVSSW